MYIVINGGGMIAEYLTPILLRQGHQVAIMEIQESVAAHISAILPNEILVICGDGCDTSTQLDAGMDKADVFVATTSLDADNLVACELAQLVFEVPRAIARVNIPRNERIFRQMGIEAVSSTGVIAQLIEQEVGMGAVRAAVRLGRDDIEMNEAVVPLNRARNTKHHIVKAKDVRLPEGALIAAVRRDNETHVVTADTVIYPGDTVIFLSKANVTRRARDILMNL